MKKAKHLIYFFCVLLCICLLCFFVGKSIGSSEGKTQMEAVVLENKLTEISQLSTITYAYTNMAQFENSKDFYGIKVPFTTKKFIITYDGEIKAGVDLSKAEVKVKGKKVHLNLPEAEILSHQIEENSLEVFDETSSIFNPLKVKDYANFSKDQKKDMERKACEKGLLDEAREKAIQYVKELFSQILDQEAQITVE